MTILTIFCCGTGSNSFDATKFGRETDAWDEQDPLNPGSTRFETLWANRNDPVVRVQLDGVLNLRKSAITAFGKNSYFQGEIVSTLATNHQGKEYVDWIQIDGPGSGNLQDHMLWTKPGAHSSATGNALGYGLQVNVRHAMAVIKNKIDDSDDTGLYSDDIIYDEFGTEIDRVVAPIKSHGKKFGREGALSAITPQLLQQQIRSMAEKKRNQPLTQVNLVGWSRGAVTGIAIANAIANDPECSHIRVNIFAVDPVPGAYAETISWQKTEIPACVNEYFGVYARDEVSVGFNPVIPKRKSSKTKLTLLPLPGMHASVAGNSHVDKNSKIDSIFNLQGPGRISRYWAEKCLVKWGVKLRRTAAFGDSELLKMYNEMLANDSEFKSMRDYSYTLFKQGNFNTFRKFYISGSGWTSNYWSIEQLGDHPDYHNMKMMFQIGGETFINWHHKVVRDSVRRMGPAFRAVRLPRRRR